MEIQNFIPLQPVYYHGSSRATGIDSIQGDFKVVRVPGSDQRFNCLPFTSKGLFKISIHHGRNKVYYADKALEIEERAILFSRPNMVYRFEPQGKQHSGYFCVFTDDFFDRFIRVNDYPLFKPCASGLIEITEVQMESFFRIFQAMEHEMELDFSYKYDAVRILVIQLILDTLKMQPNPEAKTRESNSAMRINSCFQELLEGQFPILNTAYRMHLRHPAEFADTLSVHVNHLNRSLKEVTDKTTSQLIAERILQEARILLQSTDWNVMEIAWSLGFEDLAHFIKFFKKSTGATPSGFRKVKLI
jgi:AraC family transcriptional regulator, transcriptional activator of pobA